MVASDTLDEEIDALYGRVDAQLRAGEFGAVDAALASLDVERMTITMMLAHASIAFAARRLLPAYFRYVARVRARLTQIDPERVESLLHGLEEP